ncbi:DUF2470 domain-containing protein [Streptomyces sp. KLOTTS4A1]|uniref:DUF2470 domain-containing protein n=1 Tax=Streptomyces sp. KLOTTS4A1 TaxID=3390996 RepID=UPI0039F48881
MSIDADLARPLPEPTAAEHVRSVLARATSLSLTSAGQNYDLIGMHEVDTEGRITLRPQPGSPLTREVGDAPRGGLATLLEFTDIAPTPARSRVRARVTVSGRLSPAEDCTLRLDTARVTLGTGAGTTDVGLDAVALAEPDPLAVEEAAMLTHLTDAHEDLVDSLLALAGPRLPHGIVRALPFALDRHALTLRCEYASGHFDLRLLFPAPAGDAAEAGERIHQILTSHRGGCPHRHHSPH